MKYLHRFHNFLQIISNGVIRNYIKHFALIMLNSLCKHNDNQLLQEDVDIIRQKLFNPSLPSIQKTKDLKHQPKSYCTPNSNLFINELDSIIITDEYWNLFPH